jgi:hypothetical protein
MERPNWHLGIDFGIKTFAYTISYINGDDIRIIAMDVIDLIPGQKVKDVSTIKLIGLLITELNKIKQIFDTIKERKRVVIEYQMTTCPLYGATLCALKSSYDDVIIVGPSWKNSINLASHYRDVIAESNTKYTANKKHAKLNFEYILEKYNIACPVSKKLIGHVADSFMQVLGYMQNGPGEDKIHDIY